VSEPLAVVEPGEFTCPYCGESVVFDDLKAWASHLQECQEEFGD
jgi:protein-disulfide isomerase